MEEGWFALLFIILTLFGVWFFILREDTNYPSEEERTNLTLYLNDLGVGYYYSPLCHYCKEQEKYINFELFENKYNILNKSYPYIRGTPAWEYKGEILYGVTTYEELSKRYGFKND